MRKNLLLVAMWFILLNGTYDYAAAQTTNQDSILTSSRILEELFKLQEATDLLRDQQNVLDARQSVSQADLKSQFSFSIVFISAFIVLLSVGGFYLYMNLRKDRADFKMEFDRNRQAEEQMKTAIQRSEIRASGEGGYVIIDLPEKQRSLFHDLLKGFEEFASLKGYKVVFSVDNSIPDKVAFKFTITDTGVTVSNSRVREDIKEYLERIKNDESLDELPIIISHEEHDLILTHMKNRISFLKHNYTLQKNAAEFYWNILKKFSATSLGITQPPNIFIQTAGGNMDSRKYQAKNSSHLIQGDGNEYYDNSTDSSVKVSIALENRESQIESLTKLIALLKEKKDLDSIGKEKAVVNFEKVKDELADEDKPDKSRIVKWLEKAKQGLQNLKMGKEMVQEIQNLYESFNLSELISNIT